MYALLSTKDIELLIILARAQQNEQYRATSSATCCVVNDSGPSCFLLLAISAGKLEKNQFQRTLSTGSLFKIITRSYSVVGDKPFLWRKAKFDPQ